MESKNLLHQTKMKLKLVKNKNKTKSFEDLTEQNKNLKRRINVLETKIWNMRQSSILQKIERLESQQEYNRIVLEVCYDALKWTEDEFVTQPCGCIQNKETCILHDALFALENILQKESTDEKSFCS